MISSDGIVVEVGDKDVEQNGSFCCVVKGLIKRLLYSPFPNSEHNI